MFMQHDMQHSQNCYFINIIKFELHLKGYLCITINTIVDFRLNVPTHAYRMAWETSINLGN